MAIPTIQTAFVLGEVAPALFGHVDLSRMHAAASTMRNCFVRAQGGSYSRAGTKFVGFSKQTGRSVPPRLIPFQFSIKQGLALEFGNLYMRVISNGAFVTEAPIVITNITQANPAVVTGTISAEAAVPINGAVTVSYAPGDTVTLAGGTSVTKAVLGVTNTTLLSLALNSPGTGVYAPGDTITLTGGTQTTPAVLAVSTTKVVSATVAAGGTGGTPGTQTVTGTTGTGTKFQASVTVSGGGVVTAVLSISLAGSYTVNPTTPTAEPVTGASLSGAQLNIKLGVATFAIFSNGVFTANSATFTQAATSGTGTGATFQTALYGPHTLSIVTPGDYSVFPANPVAQFATSGTGAGATFTVTQTGVDSLSNGDWVQIANVGGMTQVNGETYVVANRAGMTFELNDVYGNAVDSTGFSAYTSGGTASRIYTLTTLYAEADLEWIKYTQSADVMSVCCVNQDTLTEYAPQDLQRLADDNWMFAPVVPGPSVQPPASATVTGSSAGAVTYSYEVTAVSPDDGTESVASTPGTTASLVNIAATAGSITVTWPSVHGVTLYNVYKATPAISTATIPVGAQYGYIGFSYGNQFVDSNLVADFAQQPPTHKNPFARGQILSFAMTATGGSYTAATTVAVASGTGTGFKGRPIIGSSISGQRLTFASNPFSVGNDVFESNGFATAQGHVVATTATTADVVLTGPFSFLAPGTVFSSSTSASLISAASVSVATSAGIVGVIVDDPGQNYLATDTAVFSDSGGGSGAVATLNVGPTSGTYPSVVQYIQQRRGYFNSLNQPDTYWISQPGAYTNFDSRVPPISSDAFTGNPWAVQVNGIQFAVDMPGGLVAFTGNGAWQLTGSGGSSFIPQPIGPDSQQVQPQAHNGCSSTVPPVKIVNDIIFVPSKGAYVREIAYQIGANIYAAADITINSPHLFTDFDIRERAWCEEPFKLLWFVRDDGTMVSLTRLKDQEVNGWARHDTNGSFESVCSITEPPVDALYLATQRFPGSNTAYMIERMDDRDWPTVQETWCVDCGLRLAHPTPAATLSASSATGLGAISGYANLVGGSNWGSATTVTVIDDNGRGPGTGAVVTPTIVAGVITALVIGVAGTGYVRPAFVFSDPSNAGGGASATPTLDNSATFTASAAVFTAITDIGKVIRMGGGIATITAFTSTTVVTANITQPIIDTIPNSGGRVRVQPSGSWSLTAPVTSVSGLKYLAGATVTGLADGVVIPAAVVPATGIIALPQASTSVVVGLGYQAQLQSVRLNAGEPTMQGQRKKIAAVTMRIEASRGLKIGCNQVDGSTLSPPQIAPPWYNLVDLTDQGLAPYGSSVKPLYTGDTRQPLIGGFATAGQIAVQQDSPLPMQLLAFISEYLGGDTPQTKEPQRRGQQEGA